jgi:hypothetical protein
MTDLLIDTYRKELDQRYPTMRRALELLAERGGKTIVETGCARMKDDWGAGMSTLIFADWCSRHDAHLYSVDIGKENLQTARRIVGDALSPFVTFIESDSVEWLCQVGDASVDLVYLDSLDYPYVELLNAHGYQMAPENAIAELWEMTEDRVLDEHGEIIRECQVHCLEEIIAADHALKDISVVLIDDQNFPGGGKPRLANLYLEGAGWTRLSGARDQQALWISP